MYFFQAIPLSYEGQRPLIIVKDEIVTVSKRNMTKL